MTNVGKTGNKEIVTNQTYLQNNDKKVAESSKGNIPLVDSKTNNDNLKGLEVEKNNNGDKNNTPTNTKENSNVMKQIATAGAVVGGCTSVGAVIGAIVGSVVPGAGTVAGAALGAKVGAGIGAAMLLTSCETHEPDYIRKDFDVTTETTFNTDYTVVKPKDTKETAEYKLEVLENDTENKYHHETEDGVFYEYEVDTETYQKPYIILADGTKLDIDYDALEKSIDGKTVVNYINALGEEKEYTFSADTTGVTVVTADFGNGFTHHIGNNTDITPDTPLGVAYENFAKVGLMKNDGDLKTNIDANQGSYDTKPGFKMELMPGEISDVINNPTVKGNIGDIEFEGPMTKNGDDIVIKNKNGDEIRLTYKQNYDVGNGSEPDLYDGLLVSVNGKEAYIVADHGDGSTDIGKIDRENGTTVQHYGNQNESFDLDLPKQADEYYNEKYTNLDEARKEAHVDYYSIPVPPDIDNRSEEHKLKVHTEGYVRAY